LNIRETLFDLKHARPLYRAVEQVHPTPNPLRVAIKFGKNTLSSPIEVYMKAADSIKSQRLP